MARAACGDNLHSRGACPKYLPVGNGLRQGAWVLERYPVARSQGRVIDFRSWLYDRLATRRWDAGWVFQGAFRRNADETLAGFADGVQSGARTVRTCREP